MSSLPRNSTLETVFRLLPKTEASRYRRLSTWPSNPAEGRDEFPKEIPLLPGMPEGWKCIQRRCKQTETETKTNREHKAPSEGKKINQSRKCSMLIRLPLPQCFCPRGRKLRPWSEKNLDQNSDHPRLCIYWGKEKLRPWSEFLGRENSDHGLSFGCFWGRGRRGGSQMRHK